MDCCSTDNEELNETLVLLNKDIYPDFIIQRIFNCLREYNSTLRNIILSFQAVMISISIVIATILYKFKKHKASQIYSIVLYLID